MPFADLEGAGRLQIEEARANQLRAHRPALAEHAVEVAADGAFDHLVEGLAVPPTLGEGLAHADCPVAQDAPIGPAVLDLDVPWGVAAHGDPGTSQCFADDFGRVAIELGGEFARDVDHGRRLFAHRSAMANPASTSRGAGRRAPENIQAKPLATARRPRLDPDLPPV